ncbi:TPA: hypothetical protein QF180_004320 [Yersinia enterocolitica]|nr:hypothetical protein [Yersinia enterocolitica]
MSDKAKDELITLLDELIQNGDFFLSAIERNNPDFDFDFEDWRSRAVTILQEAKASSQ